MSNTIIDPFDEAMVLAGLHKCGGFSIQEAKKENICLQGSFVFMKVIGYPNSYKRFCEEGIKHYPSNAYLPEASPLRESDPIYSLAVLTLVPPQKNLVIIEKAKIDDDDMDYDVLSYIVDYKEEYQKCLFLIQVADINSYVRVDWGICNGEDEAMLLRYTEYESTAHYLELNRR